MNIRCLAALLILAVSLFSCSNKEEGEEIPFNTMAKGDNLDLNSGIPRQDVIIRSQEEWDDLIAVMGSQRFIETEIDFDTHLVIVAIGEVRGEGGWEFSITKIINLSDKVIVTVKETPPRFIAPTVMSQYYHVVKVPKLAKSIDFKYIK